MQESKAGDNGPNDDEKVDHEVGDDDADMAVLISDQLRYGDEGNAGHARRNAVQAEAGNEHVGGLCEGADDIADGAKEAGGEEEEATAEEVRVGAEEEDGHRRGGGDAWDHPGGEFALAKEAEELGGDGGRRRCGPVDPCIVSGGFLGGFLCLHGYKRQLELL